MTDNKKHVSMRKLEALKRSRLFDEVNCGYSEDEALAEAARCIACKNPKCVPGCPVGIDIPGFIKLIKDKNYDAAVRLIKEKNYLPAVCGRVCPQETQCQEKCIIGLKGDPIAIGYLERFVADWERENPPSSPFVKGGAEGDLSKPNLSGTKVALVGGGPSSLTCASYLVKAGFPVTVFEALHEAGGVLRYGIPDFRLPGHIIDFELKCLKELGVEIKLNSLVGKTFTVKGLREAGYKYFFLGLGAGLPYFLDLENESLPGIYSANEFLTRVNLMHAFLFPEEDTPIENVKNVLVIGGGNVAMDSARCALRLGAQKVTLCYRRTEKEMPARVEEVENAKEEGIEFHFLVAPERFLESSGRVGGCIFSKMELGEPDKSGRRRPVKIPGSEFEVQADTVIVAIGQGVNPLIRDIFPDIELTKEGHIKVDENFRTNLPDVYAGGDITTGADTVISAMAAGKTAALSIIKRSE